MTGLEIILTLAVTGYVIYKQLAGEPLRVRRLLMLPLILTIVGIVELAGRGQHLHAADLLCLAVSGGGSLLAGLGFGAYMRVESRGGVAYKRMKVAGLWLWAVVLAFRGLDSVLAGVTHAHIAASASTLLLTLGLNRLGEAVFVMPRALMSGIPFASGQGRFSGRRGITGRMSSFGPGSITGPGYPPGQGARYGQGPAGGGGYGDGQPVGGGGGLLGGGGRILGGSGPLSRRRSRAGLVGRRSRW